MTYKEFVKSIEKPPADINPGDTQKRMIHAALGMSGETGETVDLVKKHVLYNKEIDPKKIIEECGDILYYMEVLLDTVGSTIDEARDENFKKLSKRYSSGAYSDAQAKARADKEEPPVSGAW